MHQDLLESLERRGGLFLCATGPHWQDTWAQVQKWAEQWPPGQTLVVDLAAHLPQNAHQTEELAKQPVHSQSLPVDMRAGIAVLSAGWLVLPASLEPAERRQLQYNVSEARETYPYVLLVLPSAWQNWIVDWKHWTVGWLDCFEVEHYPETFFKGLIRIHSDELSDLPAVLRVSLLQKNPPGAIQSFLFRFWWFVALVLGFLIVGVPFHSDSPKSFLRNTEAERGIYRGSAFFSYRFPGDVSIQRVARYGLGRYTAAVATPSQVQTYIGQILAANAVDTSSWRRESESAWYPDSGVLLQWYPPRKIRIPVQGDFRPVWNYFTALLTDTLSYFTEYWDPSGEKTGRVHLGIDVAGRMGTRIVAPFDGEAKTFEDDRGGVVMAIVHVPWIVLYMHCDQILYLDGQRVFAGDPVATVGLTGHTTGPHVHIVTGKVNSQGTFSVGKYRYSPLDPVKWYHEYMKASQNLEESSD